MNTTACATKSEATRATKVAHPHKSTTTPELYFHKTWKNEVLNIPTGNSEGERSIQAVTAFARKVGEDWYVSYAECDWRDQFCKATGRTVARRKWFAGKKDKLEIDIVSDRPTYEGVFETYEG